MTASTNTKLGYKDGYDVISITRAQIETIGTINTQLAYYASRGNSGVLSKTDRSVFQQSSDALIKRQDAIVNYGNYKGVYPATGQYLKCAILITPCSNDKISGLLVGDRLTKEIQIPPLTYKSLYNQEFDIASQNKSIITLEAVRKAATNISFIQQSMYNTHGEIVGQAIIEELTKPHLTSKSYTSSVQVITRNYDLGISEIAKGTKKLIGELLPKLNLYEDSAKLEFMTKATTALINIKYAYKLLKEASDKGDIINNILTQQLELALESNSGSLSDEARKIYDVNFQGLAAEVDRIAKNTHFNGQKLLNGSLYNFSKLVFDDDLVNGNKKINVTMVGYVYPTGSHTPSGDLNKAEIYLHSDSFDDLLLEDISITAGFTGKICFVINGEKYLTPQFENGLIISNTGGINKDGIYILYNENDHNKYLTFKYNSDKDINLYDKSGIEGLEGALKNVFGLDKGELNDGIKVNIGTSPEDNITIKIPAFTTSYLYKDDVNIYQHPHISSFEESYYAKKTLNNALETVLINRGIIASYQEELQIQAEFIDREVFHLSGEVYNISEVV